MAAILVPTTAAWNLPRDSCRLPLAALQTAVGAFLRAVLCVRNDAFDLAKLHVERARDLMGTGEGHVTIAR